MSNKLMTGFWRYIINVPPFLWEKQIHKARKRIETELEFMSDEHRRIHHFVVRELPVYGKPLPPQVIAKKMGLPRYRISNILDDLEKHLTFLFRNSCGDVIWAYPVTVENTPHHLTFSTGETLYAA